MNSKRYRLESIPGPTDLQRSALTTTLPQAQYDVMDLLKMQDRTWYYIFITSHNYLLCNKKFQLEKICKVMGEN